MTTAVAEPAPHPPAPPVTPVRGRLGPRWLNHLLAVTAPPARRWLARAALRIDRIRYWERTFDQIPDEEIPAVSLRLRGRARGGESLDRLVPEAYGLAAVVTRRVLGMRPFDVQLAAAVVLHWGSLAELATGEGKTLVGLFPVYLNALAGRGAHVMTVNDYLANRDGEFARPVFTRLGLTVGILQGGITDPDRAKAYRCDVTYGTAGEFGFDFLRDRLRARAAEKRPTAFLDAWTAPPQPGPAADRPLDPRVQREHFFALVDEADSVLIDEASTPLIIATPTRPATPSEQVVFRWADRVVRDLLQPGDDFHVDPTRGLAQLTPAGVKKVRWSGPPTGPGGDRMDKLIEHVERAVRAHHWLCRDRQYMVHDGKIMLIDESTGRSQPDRHWQDGLHQAVEVKEGVTVTAPTKHAARITIQHFFRGYKKLVGMTGTAAQAAAELRRVYRLRVVCVPTNRPVLREQWPDWVFPTRGAKFDALVAEVRAMQALGRPVLIGTQSVEISEDLGRRLAAAGIPHEVLNAKQNDREAEIVAQAGEAGRVTIATNMAGRGTDIKLGPGVAAAGGLHVIGTARHQSRRVDRQLAGRSGRQGDPGSCQFFLALDDALLGALGARRQVFLTARGGRGGDVDWQRYLGLFDRAQRRQERRQRRARLDLMSHERHRQELLDDLAADPYVD